MLKPVGEAGAAGAAEAYALVEVNLYRLTEDYIVSFHRAKWECIQQSNQQWLNVNLTSDKGAGECCVGSDQAGRADLLTLVCGIYL